MVDSERGRIAVGWLIVEDLLMVLALVLIPAMASVFGSDAVTANDPFVDFVERIANIELGIWGILGVTVVKLAAFVGFMLVVGRRVIPFILHYTAHTGSRELFRLAVLAIALGVAAGAAYLFGVSLALGAFFAGMILSESELSHRAAQESLPLRDAFAVLFFVSVGMLFDPMIILNDPLPLIATVLIIIIGKSILSFLIVLAFRRPLGTALTISASLAQIGEFSFILAALGVGLGLLPPEGRDLILAGSIISIVLNPLVFWIFDANRPWFARAAAAPPEIPAGGRTEPTLTAATAAPAAERHGEDEPALHPTGKTGHTILIGYGKVGSVVADGLAAAHKSFLVIEDAEGRATAARAAGIEVISGNAASPRTLALANVAGASTVMIAIPNAFEAGQATEQCRKLNPNAVIVARAHSDEEEQHLKHLGANIVIIGEREIGLGMVDMVTRDRAAVAEIVAVDAVESALAPMTAAVTKHGPDIFAPALESDERAISQEETAPAGDLTRAELLADGAVPGLTSEMLPEPELVTTADANPDLPLVTEQDVLAAPESEVSPADEAVAWEDPHAVADAPPSDPTGAVDQPVMVADALPLIEPAELVAVDPVAVEELREPLPAPDWAEEPSDVPPAGGDAETEAWRDAAVPMPETVPVADATAGISSEEPSIEAPAVPDAVVPEPVADEPTGWDDEPAPQTTAEDAWDNAPAVDHTSVFGADGLAAPELPSEPESEPPQQPQPESPVEDAKAWAPAAPEDAVPPAQPVVAEWAAEPVPAPAPEVYADAGWNDVPASDAGPLDANWQSTLAGVPMAPAEPTVTTDPVADSWESLEPDPAFDTAEVTDPDAWGSATGAAAPADWSEVAVDPDDTPAAPDPDGEPQAADDTTATDWGVPVALAEELAAVTADDPPGALEAPDVLEPLSAVLDVLPLPTDAPDDPWATAEAPSGDPVAAQEAVPEAPAPNPVRPRRFGPSTKPGVAFSGNFGKDRDG